ncbi:Signal recognition particle protein [Anatilimnocola aggregata]|uniref:signal-recognition-particle GTPase n=1 Tax=Anatilimnocola aggregata TaxID=2528021 RepID=A0A517YHT7_9BACT|nr:signal recognition particle protein [Anatilimnocola aggregata]QDU29779.1 Signal recognition particle protein [Anatilimnocola aggregata]
MFESFQNSLQSALKSLAGKGKLTEANMREGLKLVENSLLEADVSYAVVKDFMASISERALGEKVLLALRPTDQLVGIVRDELINILGPVDPSLHLKANGPTILMLCGLQGSGKTTTCGKLSRLLLNEKQKPFLVAADLQRPAAIEQLHVIGRQLNVRVYSELGAQDPVKVCQDGVRKAKEAGCNVVILDTAGRLAIDKELMDQLIRIDNRVQPDQAYLVVDGMTGQDAVNSAKAFNEALELDGVIMTKLDGDARGGALMSVKQVTGVPIKFLGTGEQLDALEPFRPEGVVGRILGLGDMVGLVDVIKSKVDAEEQKKLQDRLQAGQFTLDDVRKQLMMARSPGLIQKMMMMMPGMGEISKMLQDSNAEKGIGQQIGIIDSMTPAERRNPKIITPARRNRIAKGAGVQAPMVNEVIKMFDIMGPMAKGMAGGNMGTAMKAIEQMQRGGMFNPGAQLAKVKGDTGRRMTAKEKEDMRKKREKELRKKKREQKGK